MLRLIRVELNRLRWRRAVQLLVPLALLVPLVLLVIWTATTEPADQRAYERAQQRAAQEAASPEIQRELAACVAGQGDYWSDSGSPTPSRGQCEEMILPQPEWFLEWNEQNPREAIEGYVPAISLMVAGVLALASMTYAGADWASGSMSNQLLFNPRRGQLFAAKLVAAGVLAAIVTVLTQAAWWLLFALVAVTRHLRWHGGWTGDAAILMLKATAFSVLVATLAFALTTLLRHTVAALATVIGVSAVSMLFIHGLDTGNLEVLSPGLNVVGIFFEDVTYDTESWNDALSQREWQEHVIGWLQGFGYWSVVWLVVTAAAAFAFRRRDVP